MTTNAQPGRIDITVDVCGSTGVIPSGSSATAAVYGGTAGQALDPCYHRACDTLANRRDVVLEQVADAASHAMLTFAMTSSAVNGTDKG